MISLAERSSRAKVASPSVLIRKEYPSGTFGILKFIWGLMDEALHESKSREPRAESREPNPNPKAESRKPRVKSQEPRAESESRKPKTKSQEPRAESESQEPHESDCGIQKNQQFSILKLNFETQFFFARHRAHTESRKHGNNVERDELLSKSKDELLLLAKRLLPPKLLPRSSLLKAVIADAILKAQRQPKISSFFAAVPISSSSPAKKKTKPTDCINKEENAFVINGTTKSEEAEEVESVISMHQE